jgi:hypothetical protein
MQRRLPSGWCLGTLVVVVVVLGAPCGILADDTAPGEVAPVPKLGQGNNCLIGDAQPKDVVGYHTIRADASGRIVPWFDPRPSVAYDHVLRLVWGFWRDMRRCPNGVPYYLQHQVWDAPQDDRRGLGGDQLSMALSSWNLLHAYLGEPAVLEDMTLIADYWLDHGLSSATAAWPHLPFPYNTDVHSGRYDGDMVAGPGYLQPDKAASFGAELVVLYKKTGQRRYLEAAMRIADTLAAQVTPGDASHSPWPFRVHAESGEIHKGPNMPEGATYTTNWTGALRLLADLIRLGVGDQATYARARALTSRWLMTYPMTTNQWGPFFEDIPGSSNTEINADTLALYILEHPEWDMRWQQSVAALLDFTLRTFGTIEYKRFGVVAINEQTAYPVPGSSHTARHASVELTYCEKTGDCALKQEAVRRLNWATYTVDTDGQNRYIRDAVWLTDGYGDYVRHYLRALAAAPELAPDDQNHLLRTSSVIQQIEYGVDRIVYTKFDAVSRERLKLGAWAPRSVTGGTMAWNAATRVLEIEATHTTVTISR